MIIGNTEQRYLNMMTEMSKKASFTTQLIKPFRVSGFAIGVLCELGLIKVTGKKGRTIIYKWNSLVPSKDDASVVVSSVRERVNDTRKKKELEPISPAKLHKTVGNDELVKKSEELLEKVQKIELTEQMCIDFLKNSKEYTYEIFRIERKQL